MSWINNIENIKFSITTGDGKTFFPLWKTGQKSKNYNTTIFDFIDVPKSLVERKKPQSNKHPLVFWFEGENCIDQSNEFELSADDSRIWTITHPYYGTLRGQPMSISRNDENFNISEISVEFWESIEVDYPNSNFSVKDNTSVKKDAVLKAGADSYASKGDFKNTDIQKNKESNILTNKAFEGLQTDETNADYQNIFSEAQKASDNLLTNANKAITAAQRIADYPSLLEASIKLKIQAYENAYNNLSKVFESIADKLFFESQGSAIVSSMANASVNPNETDYVIVSEIESTVSSIVKVYNSYLLVLDQQSIGQYDLDNSWQPDPIVQSDLYDLITYTIANLFDLGFGSQREKIVYTDSDTNIILLTHRYLGLASDENIETFRSINGIKNRELFKIPKGRKITYYV